MFCTDSHVRHHDELTVTVVAMRHRCDSLLRKLQRRLTFRRAERLIAILEEFIMLFSVVSMPDMNQFSPKRKNDCWLRLDGDTPTLPDVTIEVAWP